MKKQFVFSLSLFVAFLAISNVAAQISFQKKYNTGDQSWCYAMQQTNDGGYIFINSGDIYSNTHLIKTNANGDTSWTIFLSGVSGIGGEDVKQTSDGGYIITGNYDTGGGRMGNTFLSKINSNGDTLWTRTYIISGCFNGQGDEFVEQTSDGGYIISGTTTCFGGADIFIIKTNIIGIVTWSKRYVNSNPDEAHAIQQTIDGGYIIIGTSPDTVGLANIALLKLDSNGNTLWEKTYGTLNFDRGYSIQQTIDKGYIIGGRIDLNSVSKCCLLKTDSLGILSWIKTFPKTQTTDGENVYVKQTTDYGYILTGTTNDFPLIANSNIFLIKTNSIGNTQWSKLYGDVAGNPFSLGSRVSENIDGGYIIAGTYSDTTTGNYGGAYLIKTNTNGNSQCNETSAIINDSTILLDSFSLNPTVYNIGFFSTHLPFNIGNSNNGVTLCYSASIEELNNTEGITISPNPSTALVTISSEQKIKSISIKNILGEEIKTINNAVIVDLTEYSEGIYFIEIKTEKGITNKKIIKQ